MNSVDREHIIRLAQGIRPKPGEIPKIPSIDIFGDVNPKEEAGGDHIIYVDFQKRYGLDDLVRQIYAKGNETLALSLAQNRNRGGILLADVAGHSISDLGVVYGLHQAFLTGVLYELEIHGEITAGFFDKLNTRFFNTDTLETGKSVALHYGEIYSDGKYRFIQAGNPLPIVYSAIQEEFCPLKIPQKKMFPPLGLVRTQGVRDWSSTMGIAPDLVPYEPCTLQLLGRGDIMLLTSDGMLDHHVGSEYFYPRYAKQVLTKYKCADAKTIFYSLWDTLHNFGEQSDDWSLVVVKKE